MTFIYFDEAEVKLESTIKIQTLPCHADNKSGAEKLQAVGWGSLFNRCKQASGPKFLVK